MFEKLFLKSSYNSFEDDVINDFYIPCLKHCSVYNRVSAYFDSKIISYFNDGIYSIIKNKSKINYIFSNDLSINDFEEMKKGYELKDSIKESIFNELKFEKPEDIFSLSYLIALGYMDIKVAFTENGIFHDKFGYFLDLNNENNIIYFRGSNNETVASAQRNFESFDVDCSWVDDDIDRKNIFTNRINMFNDLWNNRFDGVIVKDVRDCLLQKISNEDCTEALKIIYSDDTDSIIFDIDNNGIKMINHIKDKTFFEDGIIFQVSDNLNESSILYKVDNSYYLKDIGYQVVKKIISDLDENINWNEKLVNIIITPALTSYFINQDIQIEKRKNLGIAIKHKDEMLYQSFEQFKNKVDSLMSRKLTYCQMWDSFFIYSMINSANFSVPGSGKTSTVLGAFAYLKDCGIVDKIVVIGPKNCFTSWKYEFKQCFGDLLKMNVLDIQECLGDKKFRLMFQSSDKNLILVNYENVNSLLNELKKTINNKTLLIFDEVHRIKKIDGIQASGCIEISKLTNHKVVLSGSPIPNGYKDIYNFLNILYTNDYGTFFGFNPSYLQSASNSDIEKKIINDKLFPFYTRTTKDMLGVPKAENDQIIELEMTDNEKELFKEIYLLYKNNILTLYIRLCQASSNPMLLLKDIDYTAFFDNDFDDESDFKEYENIIDSSYIDNERIRELICSIEPRKINETIKIISEKIMNGKSVIVWGIFVDSLRTVSNKLNELGISNGIISGSVPQNERDNIIDMFKNKQISVLISNPHTLAESVSLHMVCHDAIYFEFDFNLVHMLQSRDRIHRLGLSEEDKTYYTYIVLNSKDSSFNAIDLKTYDKLKRKEKLMIDALEKNDISSIEENYADDVRDILSDMNLF